MKAEIRWQSPQIDTIDLTDFGHDENKTWDDLTEGEESEILDFIRSEFVLMVKSIKTLSDE